MSQEIDQVDKCAGGTARVGYKLIFTEHGDGSLGFAKGHLKRGEPAEVAAQREFHEELGFISVVLFEIDGYQRVGTSAVGNWDMKYLRMFMLGLVAYDPLGQPEEREALEYPGLAVNRMRHIEDALFLSTNIDLMMASPDQSAVFFNRPAS